MARLHRTAATRNAAFTRGISTGSAARTQREIEPDSMSNAAFAALAITVIATALVMALGNPMLWVAADRVSQSGARLSDIPETATVLGEYETFSQSADANRENNLALAAEALNGLTIMPGEVLSVNEILGDTTADQRYLEAAESEGAAINAERGGGVCQVATALYIASLSADLEIVERHPHTTACDYAPLGLDAALAYGEKDLKIRNNGNEPVYVSVRAQGQTVSVTIGGTASLDNSTISVFSKAVDMHAATERDLAERGVDNLEPGTRAALYDVESYKSRSVDGVVKETQLVSSDTYLVVEN